MRAQRSKDFRLKTFVSERVRRWCGCVYSDFGGDTQRRMRSEMWSRGNDVRSGFSSFTATGLDPQRLHIWASVPLGPLRRAGRTLPRLLVCCFSTLESQSSSALCRVTVRGNRTAFSQLNAKSGKSRRLPRPKAPTFGGSAYSCPSPGWCRAANSRVRAKEYFRPGLSCGDTVTRYGPRYARTARVSACPWT